MKLYVGITDNKWFKLLRDSQPLDEVNFWQPSGNKTFKVLSPGELFLFKLHRPYNYIVGGGIFAHSSILPISLAWEAFGKSNGAENFTEMRENVARFRNNDDDRNVDFNIGCILIEQPFFLPEDKWISLPYDWRPGIQQGKSYDISNEPGHSLWEQIQIALSLNIFVHENIPRYGEPTLILPRLGQGSFRVLVTDTYNRRCAITGERTLPVLDAAHIKPFSEKGEHAVNNGILLRKDFHALFDKGYLTITPSMNVEVSRRIKEEFENGKDYYRYHGNKILLPIEHDRIPSSEYLDWHNLNVYRG